MKLEKPKPKTNFKHKKIIFILLTGIFILGCIALTFYAKTIGFAISEVVKEKATSTSYIYAGSKLLMSEDENGEKYYIKDHLGSSSIVLDENKEIVEEHSYWAFGGMRNKEDKKMLEGVTKYLYTGQEFDDETDLYYYGARYYDAEIGRFTTTDNLAGNINNPQSLNKYIYVLNNPLKYTDPTGNYIDPARTPPLM